MPRNTMGVGIKSSCKVLLHYFFTSLIIDFKQNSDSVIMGKLTHDARGRSLFW